MRYEEYLPPIVELDKYVEYCNFIQLRQDTKCENSLCEGHHIVPKCFLPKDLLYDKDNIVYLSCDDHLLAHKLLYECTKDKKLLYAVYQMSNTYKNKVSEKFFENSSFEQIRLEGRKASSELQRGKTFSEEHRKHLSEAHKGYVMPQSQRDKISASNKGKIKDTTWRKHLSESHKDKISRKYGTKYIHKDDKELQVWEDELAKYLSEGWELGRKKIKYTPNNIKEYVWMTNGVKNTRVHKDKSSVLEQQGWVRGRCKKSKEDKEKEALIHEKKMFAARYSVTQPCRKDFE